MKGVASPQLPFCKSYKHILENHEFSVILYN